MEKKKKRALIIIIIVSAMLFLVILLLNKFKIEQPETVIYPSGNLSDSIFDSQNHEYIPEAAYSLLHEFENLPYTVDTVPGTVAQIGTGCVYNYNDFYFYYCEVPKDVKMTDAIREQFSQVLEYGADPEVCTMNVLVTEAGFINGFSADYQVSKLSVPVGGVNREPLDAYMVSYRLMVNDGDDFSENHDIIIGVATRTLSTEALAECKQLLDVDVFTIQYNEKKAVALAKEQANIGNSSSSTENALSQDIVNSMGSTSSDAESGVDSGTLTNADVDKTAKTMGVSVQQDYNDLSVVVEWTNLEASPDIVFSDIREESKFTPSEKGDGRYVFHIGEAKAGVYMLKIKGWENAGSITSVCYENAPTENMESTTN